MNKKLWKALIEQCTPFVYVYAAGRSKKNQHLVRIAVCKDCTVIFDKYDIHVLNTADYTGPIGTLGDIHVNKADTLSAELWTLLLQVYGQLVYEDSKCRRHFIDEIENAEQPADTPTVIRSFSVGAPLFVDNMDSSTWTALVKQYKLFDYIWIDADDVTCMASVGRDTTLLYTAAGSETLRTAEYAGPIGTSGTLRQL